MQSSIETLQDYNVQEIEQFAQGINFAMLNPPYFPNTLSLWRDIKMKQFKHQITSRIQEGTSTYKDQLRLMASFIDKIDNTLLYQFKNRVREQYIDSFDSHKLSSLNDKGCEIDSNKLSHLLKNDLKDVAVNLTQVLADWQIETEVAYDILRRVHTYELTEMNNKEIFSKLPTLYDQSHDQSIMYDKLMNSLITNISDFSATTIKESCSTGWIKNTSLYETGRSFIGKFMFENQGWRFVTNLNFPLLVRYLKQDKIGGLLAETVVKKIGTQIQLQALRQKIDAQVQHLKLMTQKMKEINIMLDSLIWKCFTASSDVQEFQQNKQKIQIFLQKNFSLIDKNSSILYCAQTNQTILLEEDEDGVILMTKADITLDEQEDNDACLISSHLNEPFQVQKDYF